MKRSKEISEPRFKVRSEVGVLYTSPEPVLRIRKGDLFRVSEVFGLKVELVSIDLSCLSSAERQKLLKMEEKDARVETLPVGDEAPRPDLPDKGTGGL